MRTNKIKLMALIAFMGLSLTSCSDDDNPQVAPDNTVTGIASKASDLTLLVKALKKADLATTLQGAGPFTVFAPTDQAFIAAGLTANAIDNYPAADIPVLRQILLNHVVSGAVQSSGLTNNSYIKTLAVGSASTTNKLDMYVNTTSGVRLNGVSSVITTTAGGTFNIIATNGVIHKVDAIIGLPTIVTHAVANPNFNTLESLLIAQNLTGTLGGTPSSPFTVFAPLESAFDTATLALYNGLSSSEKRTAVLKYHVVTGANVLSNAIPTSPITTFEGGTFTVAGTVITDEQLRQTNIVLTDVQCANGVIHAVNKVLLPNSVP
ncbi:fasciclin domain-containing protein [Flavobacterium sp.]|uniref:fasciclin domain-containing protein n=1 Tax=Flavobacterium sp. TaxID=239 RepID=UPI002605088E|nr:fasciclin domain-containing protein [Flavobacterium sp.]